MRRLAAHLAGPLLLLLLLLTGSTVWSDPTAPASGTNPAPAAPAPAAPAAAGSGAAPASSAVGAALAAGSADIQVAQTPAPGDQSTPPATPAPTDQKTPVTPPATPAPPPAPAPAPKLDISGFVDMYYEYNFNRPPKFINNAAGQKVPVPGGIENNLRNFDFKANEFALNLAELQFKQAAGPVSFQVNLAFGKATDFIHAAEPGGSEVYKHLLQAFLTAPMKFWSKDDTIDAGIFVTPAGNEVIETKDNWNYTRGLLFAWAIPYYHAGLRYHHVINPTTGLQFMVVNGWNDVEDNNNSLTYGASFNTNLTKKMPLVVNFIGGPEITNDNHNWRELIDTTLTYNASDKTAFAVNLDYEHQAFDRSSGIVKGVAAYARQQLSARNAFVIRGEWLSDQAPSDAQTSTGTRQQVKELTATYEMKGPAGLLTRAEFRYDWSNKDVFLNSNGGLKGNQPTFLLGAVYAF